MFTYRYKAIDPRGRRLSGRMQAVNDADLELRLRRMELDLIACKQVRGGMLMLSGKRITRVEMITFCYHLEQLLRAGVPILEALADLRDTLENVRFREVIAAVIESIEGGQTLSDALANFPFLFDEMFCSLIKAGEQSGQMAAVLANIVDSLKWQDELAAQTKRLLIYPALVGSVVFAAITFILMYLVPLLVSFLQNMGQVLPLHTRMLIMVSDFVVSWWHVLLLVPMLLVVALRFAARRYAYVRTELDRYKLQLWLLGPLLNKIILTRFANYFSLLYASGVTILDCVAIIERIVGNRVIARALADMRRHISEGKSISESIDNVSLFPPLVLRMIRVGESTGALDQALANVSYFYNREVKETIERVQIFIEPVLTIVLAMVLGWVILAVLPPIYDVAVRLGK